tara:strand:- start:3198 stop:3536 length:339 start_codon:yes stop_codon:yes gene_type:complete
MIFFEDIRVSDSYDIDRIVEVYSEAMGITPSGTGDATCWENSVDDDIFFVVIKPIAYIPGDNLMLLVLGPDKHLCEDVSVEFESITGLKTREAPKYLRDLCEYHKNRLGIGQ